MASDAPALTMIPADEGPMDRTRRSNRWFFSGELAVSLLLHTLVAVALIGGVIRQFDKPHVDPINVELVAPPELKKPEPEEKKPDEKQQEEPKAEAPPPPPPPPPSEEKLEEKPTESELTPTVLKPVVEFGDKDSGPRKAEDGSAAQEATTSEQPEEKSAEPAQAGEDAGQPQDAQAADADPAETPPADTADTQETPKPEQTQPEETQPEQKQAEQSKPDEQPPEQAQPDQPPESTTAEAPAPEAIAEAEAPTEDFGTVGPIVTSATPAPKPAQRPAARAASNSSATSARQNGNSGRQGPPLIEARRLLSSAADGGPRARTAMAGMPPAQRLNYLCRTELDAQLIDWDPTRPPESLPNFRPPPGNLLQPGHAAYLSRGQWYDLNFRCETDKGVTRVVKFSFRIGPPLSPAEQLKRGLNRY